MCPPLGTEFAPYSMRHIFHPRTAPGDPISTSISVEALLQGAAAREDLRFEQGEDDTEGLGVTSRPTTPLTEFLTEGESGDEADAPGLPRPTSGTQAAAKKRRNAGAKKRRAAKRAKLASPGHQPHSYAAKPSIAVHHAEEQGPLWVSADAGDFPTTDNGSWIGLRKEGDK
jgi:hypothetical protein